MCDRIFLLYDGNLKADLANSRDIDSERLLHICTGGE
jgi:ABC-type sugar transport system ATPase subunit